MAFQQQGGSAANNDYDYQSGAGIDGFLSRSIDEVSWQTTLGTSYVSLPSLPIGQLPTSSTPTKFDATQVSGSVGGAMTLGGGSAQGSAGGSSGSVVIDGTNGVIKILDSSGNVVGIFGNLNG